MSNFRIYDVDGRYITLPQYNLFFNDEDKVSEREKYLSGSSPDIDGFDMYLRKCKLYNLLSDCLEYDPETGYFYWDEDKGAISFKARGTKQEVDYLDSLIDRLMRDERNGKDK